MEKIGEAREKALRHLKIADHLLTQSFPLVNDPKLLLAALQNMHLAQVSAMTAILAHERDSRRIPPFPDNVEAKLDLFRLKVAPRQKVPPEHLQAMLDARALLSSHKESSVSFARKDAFVICEEGYRLKTLTTHDMKAMLARAKAFVEDMDRIVKDDTDHG